MEMFFLSPRNTSVQPQICFVKDWIEIDLRLQCSVIRFSLLTRTQQPCFLSLFPKPKPRYTNTKRQSPNRSDWPKNGSYAVMLYFRIVARLWGSEINWRYRQLINVNTHIAIPMSQPVIYDSLYVINVIYELMYMTWMLLRMLKWKRRATNQVNSEDFCFVELHNWKRR